MSKINADTIKTSNPNIDITLGAAGDAVLIPTGATLKNNTIKDSGGNTIFQSDGSGTLSNVNSSFSGAGPHLISTGTPSAVSTFEITSGLPPTLFTIGIQFVLIASIKLGERFSIKEQLI